MKHRLEQQDFGGGRHSGHHPGAVPAYELVQRYYRPEPDWPMAEVDVFGDDSPTVEFPVIAMQRSGHAYDERTVLARELEPAYDVLASRDWS